MDILSNIADGILTLEFNRLERKNAITNAMYQELADQINAAADNKAVRALLIQGKESVFTAGNDLEDFMKSASDLGTPLSERPVFQFMQALFQCEKPVVAAVAGNAVGIGTTLLLHCDLVYLADNAKLSVPFAQLGLCPEYASSLLLPLVAGHARAAEKLMLGEAFGAQEAYAMGLASQVLPLADLHSHARAQAAKLVALPAASLRATKQLMKRASIPQIQAALDVETPMFGRMLLGAEAREAFTAFFQKRKPDFSQFD